MKRPTSDEQSFREIDEEDKSLKQRSFQGMILRETQGMGLKHMLVLHRSRMGSTRGYYQFIYLGPTCTDQGDKS